MGAPHTVYTRATMQRARHTIEIFSVFVAQAHRTAPPLPYPCSCLAACLRLRALSDTTFLARASVASSSCPPCLAFACPRVLCRPVFAESAMRWSQINRPRCAQSARAKASQRPFRPPQTSPPRKPPPVWWTARLFMRCAAQASLYALLQ